MSDPGNILLLLLALLTLEYAWTRFPRAVLGIGLGALFFVLASAIAGCPSDVHEFDAERERCERAGYGLDLGSCELVAGFARCGCREVRP